MDSKYDMIPLDQDFPFTFEHKKDKPSPTSKIPSHIHECLEINRIVYGSAKIFVNGKIIHVSEGDILLFSSHELHSWSVSPGGAEWKVFMFDRKLVCSNTLLALDYKYLEPFMAVNNRMEGKLHRDWNITNAIKTFLEKIDALFMEKPTGYQLQIKSLLLMALSKLYICFASNKKENVFFVKNNFVTLYNVQRYIRKHLFEPIALETAAGIAGMQKNYFSSFFKKAMGVNFSQYIIRLRLFHAIHLMETTKRTISDILYECGFNNESYFYRSFKEITGNSPSFYRNAIP